MPRCGRAIKGCARPLKIWAARTKTLKRIEPRAHALANGLAIHYEQGDAQQLPFDDAAFDVVCCCDVLEHVGDVDRVAAGISRVLKPDGVFFFDPINRTWRSKLAQDWAPTRFIPRDVHVWGQFIRPTELARSLRRHGLPVHEFTGLSPRLNPLRALAALVRLKLGRISFGQMGETVMLQRSTDLSLSYMGFATSVAPVAEARR